MSFLDEFEYLINKFGATSKEVKQKYYENLKKDPERWKHYLERGRQRGRKYEIKNRDHREQRKDLKTLKFLGEDKEKINEEYQSVSHPHLERQKEKAQKIKETTLGSGLNSFLAQLHKNFYTQKNTVKQTISDKLEKQLLSGDPNILPQLKGFQEEWRLAQEKDDKAAKLIIVQNMRKAISDYAEQQPNVIEFVNVLNNFRDWRDNLNVIAQQQMLDNPSDNIEYIQNCIVRGKELLDKFQHQRYLKPILTTTLNVINYLIASSSLAVK